MYWIILFIKGYIFFVSSKYCTLKYITSCIECTLSRDSDFKIQFHLTSLVTWASKLAKHLQIVKTVSFLLDSTLSGTALRQAERGSGLRCVKLSAVRDCIGLSWALSGSALNQIWALAGTVNKLFEKLYNKKPNIWKLPIDWYFPLIMSNLLTNIGRLERERGLHSYCWPTGS